MKKDIEYISLECIVPNAYQPRKIFNEDTIEELAQSIRTYGIIQPLSVRKVKDNMFELVAGERRFRAAKKLGLIDVPAIIIDITDKQSAAIALLENIQREDLCFLEEAEAYSDLLQEHNFTQKELADKIGKRQSTIANKIRLLKLDQEIRSKILENKLSERHSRALLKLPNKEIQMKVLDKIIKESFNVKKSEELIDKEINKINGNVIAKDGKKKIKGIFSSRIYINTIKQVFDKYGINASYKSKENDEFVEVIIRIPKN
ncbi:nucleoid occlusion protein [Clostridium grantii]|uniref:ParB family protein n=1 Tax=Clostridium grantii DSM 8605 TaxID=1121316 RepID=A0A1M5XGU8_9CLOT|nr:nucleoid occlusion protein [Clostridium grantii]SHH99040.1 ParB family protein [Clostridium grantii DSM 8605]